MLRGVKTKTALFTMRLSYSARAAHRAFLTQGQEAFLEGHVYALQRLGGVPCDKVRYDNLNSAVKQVLFGRSRQRTNAGSRFAATTVSKPGIASPAMRAATKKAAWKARAGGFAATAASRPVVDSIDELNALLEAADDADDARRVGNRSTSVGQDWAFKKTLLRPLPTRFFDTALTLTPELTASPK